jgi:hypothetical protein
MAILHKIQGNRKLGHIHPARRQYAIIAPVVSEMNGMSQRLTLGDPFYHEIMQHGKLLYVRNGIA